MGRILNKVQTSYKAYNGELQELSNRGLPVYQWLSKEAGIAENEVADFAASGQVTSKMFQNAIENNIGGTAKKMGEKSFTVSLANMWAALARARAAMKLITYAQSKIKDKKNKRPDQIGGISSFNYNTELLFQMIANQQKQLDAFMQIASSNKNIEQKPTGFNERDVSRAQGKHVRMMSYNLGSAF
ncbi:hypothetical protein MXL82_04965 [Staphylococcus gallinarum]|uniref:hypothetical protein n=1 Tax=Staphylococcus gallinarum TaxID=1293 RepID=UPI002DBC7948|nr:hypothetical protein [Staphylococcus gallinarum]MEB6242401.1 hypothetical protein [Staphylococcus gallinarum]MEB6295578.1 hypothetical protein [Staphylococcus gallinarum]